MTVKTLLKQVKLSELASKLGISFTKVEVDLRFVDVDKPFKPMNAAQGVVGRRP